MTISSAEESVDTTDRVVSPGVSHRGDIHSMNELLTGFAKLSISSPKIQVYEESNCIPLMLSLIVVPPEQGDDSGKNDISCNSS